MDLWEKEDYLTLVKDTVKTNKTQQPTVQQRESLEHVRCVYTRMLLQGKLRQAVCWLTSRDKGGLIQPTDIDLKTGKPVSKVLLSKHLAQSKPLEAVLEEYNNLPALIDIDATDDIVQSVVSKMQGAAGPGGVDSIAWQDWLLQFGAASCRLRKAVAVVACWLANTCPAWAAYHAIVAGRLIALDKCQGVCPGGVGEILLRMLGK
eukprot:10891218-Ditylum_brightwellii.AAC.1